MKSLLSYFKESTRELKNVTWPKQEVLLRDTIIVVVFVLVSALVLGAIDFSFSQFYQYLLSWNA